MNVLRRVYFYLVSAIALEVMIWGGVGLLRLMTTLVPSGESLAGGLAAVIVGTLVFLLHWRSAQERARWDEQDRTSWERAVFLYGMLIATLAPSLTAVVQFAGWGQGDLWPLPFNLMTAAYLLRVLREDWAQGGGTPLRTVHRWALYFWLVYGLVMMSTGLYRLLAVLADSVFGYFVGGFPRNGLVLFVVGAGVWLGVQRYMQAWLQAEPEERVAAVRQWVYFGVEFIAALVVLGAGLALMINLLTHVLYGRWERLAAAVHDALPVLLLAFGLWQYHRRERQSDAAAFPPEYTAWPSSVRQHAFLLIGYGIALAGALGAASFIARLLGGDFADKDALADIIVWLLVGTGLWLRLWRAPQTPKLRRAYLYFYILVGTLGLMAAAADWLRSWFLLAFAEYPWRTVWPWLVRGLLQAVIFGGTLRFHLMALRQETGQRPAETRRSVQDMPVYLDPSVEEAGPLLQALGVPRVEDPNEAEAAILSAEAVAAAADWPSEVVRVVVPAPPRPGWVWLKTGKRQAALQALPGVLQALARGESPVAPMHPIWLLVVYVLAGLFLLQWGIVLLIALWDAFL